MGAELTLDHVSALEEYGRARIPPHLRRIYPWRPHTPIVNRFDGRWGLTLPDESGLIPPDRSEEMTLVFYWEGPQQFDVVPNWYLMNFVAYVAEQYEDERDQRA